MSIFSIKIPKTLSGRKFKSKLLRPISPGFSTCDCCGTPWKFISGKSLQYSSYQGYFPICELCYHDSEVTFSDLINYYTLHTTTQGNPDWQFTIQETEYIINSLTQEAEKDPIIKQKYIEYQAELRDEKINKIFKLSRNDLYL